MSSLKQIAANRRNALKSTGPASEEGKRRSRCNAMRHGLTAETVITPLEDPQDYEAFEAAVISDYDAESAVERELVLRLASALWRLRRATGIESALFESVAENPRPNDDPPSGAVVIGIADVSKNSPVFLRPATKLDVPQAEPFSSNSKKDIGDCYLRLAEMPTSALDRLSRYEHTLWRQTRHIILTLESLRRRKRAPMRSSFPFSFRRREPGTSP
jgi:hypothetical protein